MGSQALPAPSADPTVDTASRKSRRFWTALAVLCLVSGAGLALLLPATTAAVALGVGVVTGAACALDVHFERGGFLPIGYAGIISLATDAAPATLLVAGLFTLGTLLLVRRRMVRGPVGSVATAVTLATITGGVTAAALRSAGAPRTGVAELATSLAIGAVVLATDAVVRLVPARQHDRITLAHATPAELAVLSSAALISLGARHGGPVAAVLGGLPLLVAHHASRQQSRADAVRAQTVRALSVVPEVAGLTEAGHGERSSRYAMALGRELGLPRYELNEVALAALVHHVGAVAFEADSAEAADSDIVGSEGARLLGGRSTLASLANLIAPTAASESLAGAAVRVAADFDHLVGDQPTRAQWALAMLANSAPATNAHAAPTYVAAATGALERLVVKDPEWIREVISRSHGRVAAAASPADHTKRAAQTA